MAGEAGLADIAGLGRIEPAAPVHGDPVVPDHHVAHRPWVGVDELRLRRELGQVVQEHAGFRDAPPFDLSGMGRQEQRLAAGYRMSAHQALADGLELGALGLAHLTKADFLARKDLGVQADQVFHLRLQYK